MIEFKNVSLAYGKRQVLRDMSFRCEKGEITALIGRNGAGKTTILKCLNGERRYKGDIQIDGVNLASLTGIERAKRISYLPQILPETSFTVRELTALGRRPYLKKMGRLSDEDCEYIENAMKLSDMLTFAERSVNTLSGGEKQRAFLSMVLAQNTDAIVLDEASTYMDAAVERELFALLKKLTKEMKKTVVAVMHNLTRAVNDADAVIIVDNGIIKGRTNAEEAARETLIEELFSVKKSFVRPDEGDQTIVYL